MIRRSVVGRHDFAERQARVRLNSAASVQASVCLVGDWWLRAGKDAARHRALRANRKRRVVERRLEQALEW